MSKPPLPNTIEMEQKILTSLNSFAMGIDVRGYTPQLHQAYTKRILEDFREALAAQRKEFEELLQSKRKELDKQGYDHSPADNGPWSDPHKRSGAYEIIDDLIKQLK